VVDLDNLEIGGFAHVHIVVADGLHVNLRSGEEGFNAEHIHDHTALGAALDVTRDDFVVFEGLVDAIPGTHGAGLFVREQQLALFVFGAFHVHFHHIPYFEVGIVPEFIHADNTFGFESDVDDHLALVHGDHLAVNNLVFDNGREGLVVHGFHIGPVRAGIEVVLVGVSIPVEVFQGYFFLLDLADFLGHLFGAFVFEDFFFLFYFLNIFSFFAFLYLFGFGCFFSGFFGHFNSLCGYFTSLGGYLGCGFFQLRLDGGFFGFVTHECFLK